MPTAPANRRIAEGRVPHLPALTGQRHAATGAVRSRRHPRGRRTTGGIARAVLPTVTLLAALVVPIYAVASGRAGWAERLVPTEEVLRLSQYLGSAPPRTIVLLFVGIFAALALIWAALCAATYALGTAVDRARRR